MRWLMAVGVSLTVLAGSGWADEIYRWTDASGAVHYSNTPTTGGAPTGLANDDAPSNDAAVPPGTPSGEQVADAVAAGAEDSGFSTDVSLRRNALEREARATDRELRDLDAQLAVYQRARASHAGGDPSTGGLVPRTGVPPADEEKTLAEKRVAVAKRAEAVQGEYGKLRDEVSARLGTVPAWWVDLKTGSR